MFDPIQQSEKKTMKQINEYYFKEKFPYIKTLDEIISMEFPAQDWLIENLLPIGSALLAGPPKIGKSYFILSLIKKIFDDNKGIYYFAGEDSLRRLQTRLKQLEIKPGSGEAYFHAGRTSPLGDNAFEHIEDFLNQKPSVRAVFIDTMQLVLPKQSKTRDYGAYVHELKPWADLACQKNVCILMVHHTRKNNGDSDQYPIDGVLGSQGINASFDTILVMKKAKDGQGSVLSVTGKDVEENEYRLERQQYGWEIKGLETIASLGERQSDVYNFITENPGITQTQLSRELSMDLGNLSRRITKQIQLNLIKKENLGLYAIK